MCSLVDLDAMCDDGSSDEDIYEHKYDSATDTELELPTIPPARSSDQPKPAVIDLSLSNSDDEFRAEAKELEEKKENDARSIGSQRSGSPQSVPDSPRSPTPSELIQRRRAAQEAMDRVDEDSKESEESEPESDEEHADIPPKLSNKPAQFDFHAQWFGATYKNLEPGVWTCETLGQEFRKPPYKAVAYVISRELHASGKEHFHCSVKMSKKKRIRSPTFWNMNFNGSGVKKANIRKLGKKQQQQGWINYVIKEGDFIAWNVSLISGWRNYRRNRDDLAAFIADHQGRRRKAVVFPLTININGTDVVLPGKGKKRHALIIGPPNVGKTTNVDAALDGCRYYTITSNSHQFDWYQGEEVFFFNDIFPKRSDLVPITDTRKVVSQLDARYSNVKLAANVDRTIIIAHNERPTYADDPWFTERFTEYHV